MSRTFIRNNTVSAMIARHPRAGKLHDRRQDRGGARNEQSQWLDDYETELEETASPDPCEECDCDYAFNP